MIIVPAYDRLDSKRKGVIRTMIDDNKLFTKIQSPNPNPVTRSLV